MTPLPLSGAKGNAFIAPHIGSNYQNRDGLIRFVGGVADDDDGPEKHFVRQPSDERLNYGLLLHRGGIHL